MAVSDELGSFVKEALARGASREQVEDVLLRAGWTAQQVRAALAGYAAVDFVIPVPRPRPYLSARDAFMYLVLFSTLYVSAYHLGSLVFTFIERAFPDAAATANEYVVDYTRQRMRWSLASLIVAFPVFVAVSRSLDREIRRDPTKRSSMVTAMAHLSDAVSGRHRAGRRCHQPRLLFPRRRIDHAISPEGGHRGGNRRGIVLVLPLRSAPRRT